MKITVKIIWINDITDDILSNLKIIFDKSYYNSKMYVSFLEDIKQKHEYFKIFLAYNNKNIVWIGVLEDKVHLGINYYNHPPVHIKRFTVNSDYRWYGIWKIILDEIKKYAFNTFNLSVIYWESNEIWAISFYLREWALFSLDSIKNYSNRNNSEENLFFFKELIQNKKFRHYRYPTWKWLIFVYVKNSNIKKDFERNTFVDYEYLLIK